MKIAKLFGAAALLLAASVSAQAFDCTGDGNCNIIIDGLSDACLTQIEITTGPLNPQSGTVSLALCDYKALDGVCFDLELPAGNEGRCTITQTEEVPGQYRYEYASNVVATVPGYPGTFSGGDLLRLRSVNLSPYQLGDDPNPVTYGVADNVVLTNGFGNTLLLEEGSSVAMLTTRPKVLCDLNGKCIIEIDGSKVGMEPAITIESEDLSVVSNTQRVSIVTYKKLIGQDGLEMTLDEKRAPDESYFLLDGQGGADFFPARVRGYFAAQIDYEGEVYRTEGVLEIQSTVKIFEWPPAVGEAQYEVVAPTVFYNESGSRKIVVQEGHIRN